LPAVEDHKLVKAALHGLLSSGNLMQLKSNRCSDTPVQSALVHTEQGCAFPAEL
jgi:hypothetical protein